MHELSIISSVVDSVTETLEKYPGARVTEVRLRVGALAAVIEDSLQFCYGIAIEDTPLAGSLEDLSVGGQGIRLLRRFANSLEYRAVPSGNRLRIGFSAA